jgi:hypothetical protein
MHKSWNYRPGFEKEFTLLSGKRAGFSKKAGAWYRTGEDVVTVVELQKSQYGKQYYVNVALWILSLGEAKTPKERRCHVRTRLSRLVGDREAELSRLLDLESPLADDERRGALTEFLGAQMAPVIDVTVSVETLRSPEGQRLVGASLVGGP